MSEFTFFNPGSLSKSIWGGDKPGDNYRVRSLLLILGQGKLQKRNSHGYIQLTNDFTKMPYGASTKLKISDIKNNIFSTYSKKEIENFFINSFSKNIVFHKKINIELLTALGYLEQNNYIASFVSIYRIYEQIALCLPIITLIKNAQFPATFDDYKKLIDNKAKSDLSVLKKYSENILDPNIGNISIQFDFSNTSTPGKNVNLIRSFIPQAAQQNVIVSVSNTTISIKLKYLHTIVITFRNQFFHYLFHEKNIDYNSLPYPEEFLEICNPLFINFYSIMFLDLLNAEIDMWG